MGLCVGYPLSFNSCMCIKLAKLVLPFALWDIPVFFSFYWAAAFLGLELLETSLGLGFTD